MYNFILVHINAQMILSENVVLCVVEDQIRY